MIIIFFLLPNHLPNPLDRKGPSLSSNQVTWEPKRRCLKLIIKSNAAGSCHHLLIIPFVQYSHSSTRNKMKLLTLVFIFLATMVYGSFGFVLPIFKGIDVSLDVGSRDIFEPAHQRGYKANSHRH